MKIYHGRWPSIVKQPQYLATAWKVTFILHPIAGASTGSTWPHEPCYQGLCSRPRHCHVKDYTTDWIPAWELWWAPTISSNFYTELQKPIIEIRYHCSSRRHDILSLRCTKGLQIWIYHWNCLYLYIYIYMFIIMPYLYIYVVIIMPVLKSYISFCIFYFAFFAICYSKFTIYL